MAKSTSAFLKTLLEQIKRKVSTPEIITGAWHLAVKSKDIEAMAEIAAADGLPVGVLDAVMKRNEIPVAVSYLTRPGLDLEQRRARIRAEERAGVLAGVLECSSITEDDRNIIAAKLVAKPTRALAEATIADHSMPLLAVATAIIVLDSRINSLTDMQRSNLRRQIKRVATDADASTLVATSAKSNEIVRSLLSLHPQIEDDAFDTALIAGVEPSIARMASDRITPNTVYHVVRELRPIIGEHGNYHPDSIHALIVRHFDDEIVAKIWTDLVGAARALTAGSQSDYTARMIQAANSVDNEELTALVADVVATKDRQAPLVDSLVLNPNLSLELLKVLEPLADHQLLIRRLPSVANDEEQVLYIYDRTLSDAISEDQWRSFPDRARGQKLVFDQQIVRWRERRSSYYSSETRAVMSIIDAVEDKAALVALLPWGMVEDHLNSYGEDHIWSTVAQLQARHLGDDLDRWETAQTLSHGFAGTVEELFFSAANL